MRLQISVDATVMLQPTPMSDEVTVTAYRSPLGALGSPTCSRLLSQFALKTSSAITLDGKIYQLPGVELFRRSNSLVANPSSQVISLRGLGSTSVSCTLVTQNDVPLNNAVGGWIHWDE
jgi:outer membrane receptor for Fe3+-dicitrate